MPLDLFNKAINEARKHTRLIALHILGDPLKIANLSDYLDIAKNANLSIEITTSGAFLDDFMILLHPSIKQINFSLDAIIELKNKEEKLVRIFEFCDFKIKQNSQSFLNLRIQKRARNKILLELLQKRFNIALKQDLLAKSTRIKLGDKIIIDFRDTFAWDSDREDIKGTCFALNSHIGILSNGIIIPCCIDTNGTMPLGNIKDSSIINALNSKRARDMIEGFERGDCVESTCKTCDYKRRFHV